MSRTIDIPQRGRKQKRGPRPFFSSLNPFRAEKREGLKVKLSGLRYGSAEHTALKYRIQRMEDTHQNMAHTIIRYSKHMREVKTNER